MTDFTLSELAIVACAELWRHDGEVLATGIGTIPRIAAGLAKLTHNPALLMTDGEAYLIEQPLPLGPREDKPQFSGWMPYSRVFDVVWRGRRHAVVTPTQVDRYGQGNISCIGDFHKPKVQMLGLRGFPGNSINHANSMFIPNHNPRVFVPGEVDVVCSAGYNPARWPDGKVPASLDIRRIVTDLCVLDFGGPEHALRVVSLHPGVTFDEVQAATGFPLTAVSNIPETPRPTAEQLDIIRRLDPHNLRAAAIKNNPPGIRPAR
jgi:glutaconate CoA-transferase subunit B